MRDDENVAAEEGLGAEFQKSVNLEDRGDLEALESRPQVSTECEAEQQIDSLCSSSCGTDSGSVGEQRFETSAHKVACAGKLDPLLVTPVELPPGIRRCVELQRVTISEDPRCAVFHGIHTISLNF
jgi:hypothetical protein